MPLGPRQRLLTSAIALVSEHGVAGTGLAELLARSGTARNSIYQHFPGGKSELVAAATLAGGAWVSAAIPADPTADVRSVVGALIEVARQLLRRHDFRRGCPVVAAAVSGDDGGIEHAAAAVFDDWRTRLSAAFGHAGLDVDRAESFAGFVLSAVEGALVQSRVARDERALDDAAEHLHVLAGVYAANSR